MKKVWVVGLWIDCNTCNASWYLKGIYDTEKKAIAACTFDFHFVGPVILNKEDVGGDVETAMWKGCWYPRLETKEEAQQRFKKGFKKKLVSEL